MRPHRGLVIAGAAARHGRLEVHHRAVKYRLRLCERRDEQQQDDDGSFEHRRSILQRAAEVETSFERSCSYLAEQPMSNRTGYRCGRSADRAPRASSGMLRFEDDRIASKRHIVSSTGARPPFHSKSGQRTRAQRRILLVSAAFRLGDAAGHRLRQPARIRSLGRRRRVHQATFGDVLIALSAFWTAAWAARSRLWFLSSSRTAWVIYLGMGVLLTVSLEWLATGALQRWTYASEMPVIPWTPIGVFPLLQWVVVPPLVIWIARRQIGPRPEV